MVSEVLDNLELYFKGQLMQGFQSGFHCVIPSGFKGPAVSKNSDLQ